MEAWGSPYLSAQLQAAAHLNSGEQKVEVCEVEPPMSKQTFIANSRDMALEQPRWPLGKVYTVFATKLKSFTFLPVMKKLPKESTMTSIREKDFSAASGAKEHAQMTLGEPVASKGSMTDEGVYKAEIVYIHDFEGTQEAAKDSQTQLTPTPSPVPSRAHTEFSCQSPRPSTVTMEAADNKQLGISQLECHDTFEGAEVSSGLFLNSMSQREEEVLSPASSVDLFPSIASSKESILSDGWERDRNWSALQMLSPGASPVPFSGTVSPCSSVRSGAFTPSVLKIRRHTLAPGSSLVQMPFSSEQTICFDSQTPSPYPQTSRVRHRPPPTQLSLLTAILRKGRLPILSSALQRPYTPCWPISPDSMSSCIACSAASAIAPMEATKTCTSKGKAVTDKLVCNVLSLSPKKQTKFSNSSGLLGHPETVESERFIISRGVHSLDDSNLLTLPSFPSPSEPSLRHLSKPDCKDSHVSTVPSTLLYSSFITPRSLSPKSSYLSCCSSDSKTPTSEPCAHSATPLTENSKELHNILASPSQGHGNKSTGPSPILKHPEPLLNSKPGWVPRDPSPIPDIKLTQHSKGLSSPVLKEADDKPHLHLPNRKKALLEIERVLSASPALKRSPSPGPVGLTRLACTPDISRSSPRPSSRSSTPDRCMLSPSPAVPSRQLSPSPSYSLRSSPCPSPREGTSDCADRDSRNRKPYKIKSAYKAMAAIPTNTLLLEQQAINDDVEKNEASLHASDKDAVEDPHAQMSTPAQLRQQSAELYAAIDEVLEDTNLARQSNPAKLAVKSAPSKAQMADFVQQAQAPTMNARCY
ncbi:muscular LMNA-interacting protein [Hoplias malabaricus]|uniref:muscular LMNA-interacting protein n=1 Tax=Hoplias malabaricus TaxID=27720 RepID=UPI003461FC46